MKTGVSRRAFLAAVAGLARAQEATFSTDVKVVSVLATVRDRQGKIVAGLTRDDFDLAEDGRQQRIRYFSRETDLPLTLGLLVDTSLSQRRVWERRGPQAASLSTKCCERIGTRPF